MVEENKLRVLIAKPGWDGHDRGVFTVARYLRDAGVEVIYLGRNALPETIAVSAIQEDVDMVGLSMVSVDAVYLFSEVKKLLKEKGGDDIVLFGGGLIPKRDYTQLKEIGVDSIFGPGTPLSEISAYVLGKALRLRTT